MTPTNSPTTMKKLILLLLLKTLMPLSDSFIIPCIPPSYCDIPREQSNVFCPFYRGVVVVEIMMDYPRLRHPPHHSPNGASKRNQLIYTNNGIIFKKQEKERERDGERVKVRVGVRAIARASMILGV